MLWRATLLFNILKSMAAAALLIAVGEAQSQTSRSSSAQPAQSYINGFPDEPTFFPIGVWLQQPSLGAAYKALGINTFVGLWNGPTEQQLSRLSELGLYAVAEQNDIGLGSPHGDVIKAWMHPDEPDNAQQNMLGFHISCIPPDQVVRRTFEMKRKDPSRPVFVNFGQGVADTKWLGRGTCTGDTSYYRHATKGIDVVSFDIYPITNATGAAKGHLEYVAQGVANLKNWAEDARAVWAIIETTHIHNDTERPTPGQIRAEVWLSIVAGAKGIVYFVHEFSHGFREDGIFRYPDAVAAVRDVNKEVQTYATALNSPTLPERVEVAAPGPVGTLLKRDGDNLYLFTVSKSPVPIVARITIPGVHEAVLEVLGENRVAVAVNGKLEQAFEPYGVHLYRLSLP